MPRRAPALKPVDETLREASEFGSSGGAIVAKGGGGGSGGAAVRRRPMTAGPHRPSSAPQRKPAFRDATQDEVRTLPTPRGAHATPSALVQRLFESCRLEVGAAGLGRRVVRLHTGRRR
jgi:hypothetical protein